MRLTKRHAINVTIKLWEWLAKTGKLKYEWPGWVNYGHVQAHCLLCEYGARHRKRYHVSTCSVCPYRQKFGSCTNLSTPFSDWTIVITPKHRKEYAAQFLAQLKQL